MAFLLLLHEKMRLRRQVNKLTLKQVRYGNRLDRMTKNIERVQKMYSKKQAWLQKQASILQSQFATNLQNTMGLGTMNQAFNPWGGGGATSFVLNQMGGILASGVEVLGKDKKTQKISMTSDEYARMLQDYNATGLKENFDENDPKKSLKNYGNGQYSYEQVAAFQQAMQTAQSNQSQAQAYCQMATNQYQQNISIWLEAAETQMELEQQEMLAPLEMEQTEMELEKDSIETQLEYARERLKNIEQACSEEIKDAAPKFGLG